MALGSTQPLTEMSTRNLPGGKDRTGRKADNLTAMSPFSRICGRLDVTQPYGPLRSVTGIALHFRPINIIILLVMCCGVMSLKEIPK
jgi:hypothetical protein